jgi:NADPH:quinone reductase-like Zn-dependent oxidoreductase
VLPIAATAALQALVQTAAVTAGQSVLITAGAGGTGTLAIDLAKHLGARVVATAGPADRDYLLEIGADQAFDYTSATPADLAAAGRFDVLLDCVSSDSYAAHYRGCVPGGHAIRITPPLPAATPERPRALISQPATTLDEAVHLVQAGVVTVRVGKTFRSPKPPPPTTCS